MVGIDGEQAFPHERGGCIPIRQPVVADEFAAHAHARCDLEVLFAPREPPRRERGGLHEPVVAGELARMLGRAATSEISGSVSYAAEGTSQVSTNISSVSEASTQVGAAAGQILGSASQLSRESERLKREVSNFLAEVRAA